jgi:cytochrome c
MARRSLCYNVPTFIDGASCLWSQPSMFSYRRLFVAAAAVLATAGSAAGTKPDIENGKASFDAMCGVCHSVMPGAGGTPGPNLLGIIGRKAASQADFPAYSSALKASKIKWSKKTLDKFLVNPSTYVPGTSMPMLIADKKMRDDVVAYLATLKK